MTYLFSLGMRGFEVEFSMFIEVIGSGKEVLKERVG
jgi:hypothetical protein